MDTRQYRSFLLLLLTICTTVAYSQDFAVGSTEKNLVSKHHLYKTNFLNGEKSIIWTVPQGHHVMDYDIKISPMGDLIGFLITGKMNTNENGVALWDRKLVLIRSNGDPVTEFHGAQRFSWSPDGSQIAYLSGIKYEGYGFKPENLVVVSLANGNSEAKVLSKVVSEQDVVWAEFDSMIYTTNYDTVFQYNPENNARRVTSYKGIYFSPDGQYLFQKNYMGGGVEEVYERRTNRKIDDGLQDKLKGNFATWISREAHMLVVGDFREKKRIIDLASKRVTAEINGAWLGYSPTLRKVFTNQEELQIRQ